MEKGMLKYLVVIALDAVNRVIFNYSLSETNYLSITLLKGNWLKGWRRIRVKVVKVCINPIKSAKKTFVKFSYFKYTNLFKFAMSNIASSN